MDEACAVMKSVSLCVLSSICIGLLERNAEMCGLGYGSSELVIEKGEGWGHVPREQ